MVTIIIPCPGHLQWPWYPRTKWVFSQVPYLYQMFITLLIPLGNVVIPWLCLGCWILYHLLCTKCHLPRLRNRHLDVSPWTFFLEWSYLHRRAPRRNLFTPARLLFCYWLLYNTQINVGATWSFTPLYELHLLCQIVSPTIFYHSFPKRFRRTFFCCSFLDLTSGSSSIC